VTILRLACSPNGVHSESFRLSQFIVEALSKSDAALGTEILEIDANRLSHVDAPYARALGGPCDPEDAEGGSLGRSDDLIQSLSEADYVVIATPMHNYTVPSGLKSWIDHVVRIRHTFSATPAGKIGKLADRPVFVAVSSGAVFSGSQAHQPDFLTPYLKAVLATIGFKCVTFFSVQGSAKDEALLEEARLGAQAEIAEYFMNWSVKDGVVS